MDTRSALDSLRRHEAAVRSMGATGLFLFGSVARNEATPESDLDLFIDYDESGAFSLLDLVGIKQYLEESLHAEIDVTTRDSLHPALREKIEGNAIQVF